MNDNTRLSQIEILQKEHNERCRELDKRNEEAVFDHYNVMRNLRACVMNVFLIFIVACLSPWFYVLYLH